MQEERIIFLYPEHVPRLVELERLCFETPWGKKEFRALMSRDSFLVLGLAADQELIGYLSFLHVRDQVEILNLAIRPGCREKGRAKELLSELLGYCRSRGVEWVSLEVRASNRAAINLYQGFGFQLVGTRERYYPDTLEDALVYQLELPRK